MHTTGSRPRLVVTADGHGVVSHAGSRLLADLAEATGLTSAFGDALRRLRPRGTGHDPGRIAVDLAVMLADGGQAIADLALLRDQPEVFGAIASTPTAWRLLAGIDPAALDALRAARTTAREVAWLQAGETRDGIPASRAGGRELPGLILDIDATLVTCHSEKEHAAPTYKHGFGYHPLLCASDRLVLLEEHDQQIDKQIAQLRKDQEQIRGKIRYYRSQLGTVSRTVVPDS